MTEPSLKDIQKQINDLEGLLVKHANTNMLTNSAFVQQVNERFEVLETNVNAMKDAVHDLTDALGIARYLGVGLLTLLGGLASIVTGAVATAWASAHFK